MKTLITRADKIGAIDRDAAVRRFKQHSARGYNSGEPYDVSAEPPTLVPEAVRVHLEEHEYSLEDLAEKVAFLHLDEFVKEIADLPSQRRPHMKLVQFPPLHRV